VSYPTKEQWAELERKMSHAYGAAHLMVDGYKLPLQVTKDKGLSYTIIWYVNGKFKGAWLSKDSEEGRRFARPISTANYKPIQIQKYEKIFGKKGAEKLFPKLHEKSIYYQWSWPSFKPLMRHLMANNKSIDIVNGAEAAA
jgi:hypothetical protein